MGLSLMEALQHPTPNGENTNKFQCWGVEEGWLPKPGGMPRYTRRGRGSLHRGQAAVAGEERYSNTKATVNTTPWVGLETGRKSKQS